jgi:flagellar motor switch protein FliG
MWDKLGNVNEAVLANYLKNEYPQTVAVVLSKIKSSTPPACWPPCRRLRAGMRHPHAAHGAGAARDPRQDRADLRPEFMSNLARTSKRDSHEMMAEIFNNFDRQTESRFIAALEERNRESAERIRALMFVFEDLAKLDPAASRPCCARSRRTSWPWP